MWRLNVRRATGKPKYCSPAGFRNSLYGADGVGPKRPTFVVEGEFDALAVTQEAGDLVAAVATGGTCGAQKPRWVKRLSAAPVVLVAFDDDEAGEKASAWWLRSVPRAKRWAPSGDPAGMLERGEDLRTWVQDALTGTPAEERGEARVPPISVEEGDWIS